MRPFLVVVMLVGLGALYLWQKQSETPSPTPVVSKSAAAPASQATATPKREVSEHNWMKRSLDRASDVARKTRARADEAQEP
jgi:hypothetical protein